MIVYPVPGTLPEGFCPATEQARLDTYATHLAVTIPEGSYQFIIQAAKPGPSFQTGYVWKRLVNGYPERDYLFVSGVWFSPHPIQPSGNHRALYIGSLPDLINEDGGSAGAVTATTGPMWEEDTTFIGRSPMHPGLIPGTTDTLAVAANYGTALHLLVFAEMLNHAHGIGNSITAPANDAPSQVARGWSKAGTLVWAQDWTESPANIQFTIGGGDRGTTEPIVGDNASTGHQTVHPVRGIYVIKRTARLGYVVP